MGWDNRKNGSKRRNTWDEENRLRQVRGPQGITQFGYDDRGVRIVKLGRQGETVYVNQFYMVRNGAIVTKHVFAGTTRVASKLQPGTVPSRGGGGRPGGGAGGGPPSTPPGQGGGLPPGLEKKDELPPGQGGPNPGLGRERRSERAQERAQDVYKNPTLTGEKPGRGGPAGGAAATEVQGQRAFTGELPGEFLYFYHPDHLGSTSYVTDDKGAIYEHLQYFPFGETWVQEGQPSNRIPYLFSSKELDAETGLYYFGARYFDPRTSLWVSPDPSLAKYLPKVQDMRKAEGSRELYRPEESLPAQGGVFNSLNLNLYAFATHNPLRLIDPDGREIKNDTRVEIYDNYVKVGGSRAWRTNNPGNLEFHEWQREYGAFGTDTEGRFAKFRTVEGGRAALRARLRFTSFRDLTVRQAIEQYAPRRDGNDVDAYLDFLEKNGVDLDATVGSQVETLAVALEKFESGKNNEGLIIMNDAVDFSEAPASSKKLRGKLATRTVEREAGDFVSEPTTVTSVILGTTESLGPSAVEAE